MLSEEFECRGFEEFSSDLKSLLASSLRSLPAAFLLFPGGRNEEVKKVRSPSLLVLLTIVFFPSSV